MQSVPPAAHVRVAFAGERRAGVGTTAGNGLHPLSAPYRAAIAASPAPGPVALNAAAIVVEPLVRNAAAALEQTSARMTMLAVTTDAPRADIATSSVGLAADDVGAVIGDHASGDVVGRFRDPAPQARRSDAVLPDAVIPGKTLAIIPAVEALSPAAVAVLAGPSPVGAGVERSVAAPDSAVSEVTAAPRQTARGIEFEVAARFNGRTAGRISLLLEDSLLGHTDRVSDNISVRLGDLVDMFHARMPAELLDRLGSSNGMQRYVTLNDLRSNGISVSFDDKDRLVFGTM